MAGLRHIDLDEPRYGHVQMQAPWGIHIAPQKMLALFVVKRGAAWFQTDNKFLPRIELKQDDLVGVSAGVGYTLSSAPDLPHDSFDETDKIFRDLAPMPHDAPQTENTILLVGYIPIQREVLAGIYPEISIMTAEDGLVHSRTLKLIDMIAGEYAGSENSADHAITKRLTEALAIEMIRNVERKRALGADRFWHPTTTDRPVMKALELLHDAPERDWTLEILAHEVGLSRSVFAERFRVATEATPIAYLSSIRINRAITFIEEASLSLSEIAHAVGYQSEAAFSRAFLREKGLTPGRFRSACQDRAAE